MAGGIDSAMGQIIGIVISFVVGGALTYLVTAFRKTNKFIAAIAEGVKATLADRMFQAYKDHMKNGYCDFNDLRHLQQLYTQYKNLGGNGAVDKLVEDICDLPTLPPNSEE